MCPVILIPSSHILKKYNPEQWKTTAQGEATSPKGLKKKHEDHEKPIEAL